jgi:hypothetical protein
MFRMHIFCVWKMLEIIPGTIVFCVIRYFGLRSAAISSPHHNKYLSNLLIFFLVIFCEPTQGMYHTSKKKKGMCQVGIRIFFCTD